MNFSKGRIIAFSGAARSGKDTAARAPCLPKGTWARRSFAGALKDDVMYSLVRSGRQIGLVKEERPQWEWFNDPVQKSLLRPLLVAYGATMRAIDPLYWIKRLSRHYLTWSDERLFGKYVITDLRYKNEAEWVRSLGGIVIGITREGVAPANEEEETSLATFTPEFTICNNGTETELWRKVSEILVEAEFIKEEV